MRSRTFILAHLLSLLALAIPGLAYAQGRLQVVFSNVQAEYEFGSQLVFRANIDAIAPIQELALFLQPQGETEAIVIPSEAAQDGQVEVIYNLENEHLRAFTNLRYWFRVILQNGAEVKSDEFGLYYGDDRFNWRILESEPFVVYWYAGGLDFAQEILNVAQAGLDRSMELIPLSQPERVQIYAYENAQDLQEALFLSGQNWIAGHADPDLGVILVSLPAGPEQSLEMERQIPHELMHVLLYRRYGPGYRQLPAWLNEGLASANELYPNPDYRVLLENGYRREALLPIESLCQVFPRDASGALLAYAQAASFTSYLYQQYGSPGIENLIDQYTSGVACDRGPELAFGTPLSQLEIQWRRETFSEDAGAAALESLLPWVIVLAAMLAVPLGLSLGSFRRKPEMKGSL